MQIKRLRSVTQMQVYDRQQSHWRITNLVTEDLYLRVRSVDGSVAPVIITVGVNLDHKRKTFDSLLWGEIRAQAVHRNENLKEKKEEEDEIHAKISLTKHASLSLENFKYGQAIMSHNLKRGEPGGSFSTPSCSTVRGMFAFFRLKTRKVEFKFIWNLFLRFKTRKQHSEGPFHYFLCKYARWTSVSVMFPSCV